MRLGFHVAISGGLEKALQRAAERRCTALQVFTAAPVQWARKPLDPGTAQWFRDATELLDVRPVYVHGAYLPNLATPDDALWVKSRENLAEELGRAAELGAAGVVVHLGSVGPGGSPVAGLDRVTEAVDWALERDASALQVVLENCAGQGDLVGCTPEALGYVVQRSRFPERLGVCLDTAHAFAHGYDLRSRETVGALLDECEASFGLERLCLVHANDTTVACGSRVDRHWHVGKGEIGRAGFTAVMSEPRLQGLAFIMETPEQEEWHRRDMRALRSAIPAAVRPPLPPVKAVPRSESGKARSRSGG